MRRMMSADVKNLSKNNSIAFPFWLKKMKKAPTQEDGPARSPMQKKSAKTVTTESNHSSEKIMAGSSKAADTTSKRACICAPTNHAGSFRCHLHRAKIMSCNTAPDIRERSGESFSSKIVRTNDDGQPRLSRFGRAACENPPLTKTSSKLEKVK